MLQNRTIGEDIAKLIKEQELFVEVIIAPDFTEEALKILQEKKIVVFLKCLPANAFGPRRWQAGKNPMFPNKQIRSCFNGLLVQDRDVHVESINDFTVTTERKPTEKEKRFVDSSHSNKTFKI